MFSLLIVQDVSAFIANMLVLKNTAQLLGASMEADTKDVSAFIANISVLEHGIRLLAKVISAFIMNVSFG